MEIHFIRSPVRFERIFAMSVKYVFISTVLIFLSGCAGTESKDMNAEFEKYTEQLFRSEVSSNTINLHYTLKEPENYGIKDSVISFGEFSTKSSEVKAVSENMERSLDKFDYEKLDVQNRITYDILSYQIKMLKKSADYLFYDEPLSLVNGVQTQLPVILSEYQFYDHEDVDIYLNLLETTGKYFDSLIEFERKKAAEGLFMPDYAADTVITQCNAFLAMENENYLYSTFADKIKDLEELTEKEKSEYIQDNALAIQDNVIPAYEKLVAAVQELRESGKTEGGLSGLPDGKNYYELTVKAQTGSDRSVKEMQDLTRRQIVEDLESMEQVLGLDTEEVQQTAASADQETAEMILEKLKNSITDTFPEVPETSLHVKYVPEEMEEHLSPAFYMIPAIDHTDENVIYINRAHMNDQMTLFTTLAHEGYPGHLYQTLYFESTDPDPVRSILDFGGYVEGWATYAEMGSYYLMQLPKEQAVLLQKNSSIILGLYALADIGIHYDGWDRMDTIAFYSNYGIKDAETVNNIYNLIIGDPGNYLKYYIGYVEFLELKKKWIDEADSDYSQKDFHEAVLSVGPAPFQVVEEYMWRVSESPKR